METKITSLYEHLLVKNPNGITLKDAKNICLLLYCTLDPLPLAMRSNQIGRDELTETFSRLASAGKITEWESTRGPDRDSTICDPSKTGFWNQLIDDLLVKKVTLDMDFQNKHAHMFV